MSSLGRQLGNRAQEGPADPVSILGSLIVFPNTTKSEFRALCDPQALGDYKTEKPAYGSVCLAPWYPCGDPSFWKGTLPFTDEPV